MIEGYIIKIERCLRSDDEYVFITSDTVFTNLTKAIEESRKLYNKFCEQIEKEVRSEYSLIELQDEDPFDEKRFCDDGAFFIRDGYGHYVDGYIEKVNIDIDNKKETND